MLKPDSNAPQFVLPDEDGNDVSLSNLLQQGPLIVYFYPADFTPGCTKEACDFRDIHGDMVSAGLRVIGISPQDGESHKRFREEHQLPFTLLSDVDKVAIKSTTSMGHSASASGVQPFSSTRGARFSMQCKPMCSSTNTRNS